jgi:hypothetical protein
MLSNAQVCEERQQIANHLAGRRDPLIERPCALGAERSKTFVEVARFVIERDRHHWGATSFRAWENSLKIDIKRLADLGVAEVSVEDISIRGVFGLRAKLL